MGRACKHCGSEQHTAFQCFNKPRVAMKTRKAINRVGPVTAKWIETRHAWIQANANKSGEWQCYICHKPLTAETLTLDHIKSRSRHPELRFEFSNLAPCCATCNAHKGSRDLLEL